MGGAVSMFRGNAAAVPANSSNSHVGNAPTIAPQQTHQPVHSSTSPYNQVPNHLYISCFPSANSLFALSLSQPVASNRSSPNPATNSPLSLQPIEGDYTAPTNHPSTSSSPRVIVDMSTHVPYTPHGPEADLFKYYCPLCMLYYKNILKVPCCGNYVCFSCTKDYVSTKGLDHVRHLEDLETNFILLAEITCPNCFNRGFCPSHVGSHEMVRDYSMHDEPNVPRYNQPSPVRVGESFEDLKRKMIPFKAMQGNNTNDNQPGPGAASSSAVNLPVDGTGDAQHVNGIAMMDESPLVSHASSRHHGSSQRRSNNHDEEHDEHSRLAATFSDQTPRQPESTPRQQRYVLSVSRTHPHDQDQDNDDSIVRRLPITSSRRGSRDNHVEDENLFRLITSTTAPTPSANKYEARDESKVDEDLIYHEDEHESAADVIPDHLSETADMEDSLEGSAIMLGKINFTEHQLSIVHEKIATDFMNGVMGVAIGRNREYVE